MGSLPVAGVVVAVLGASRSQAVSFGGMAVAIHDAVNDLLAQGYCAVCLIDSDGPTLRVRYLGEAVRFVPLPHDRIVISPALAAQYYLFGFESWLRALFDDIAWSTSGAFKLTNECARTCGGTVHVLERWYNVDDTAELEIPRSAFERVEAGPRYAATITRRYLAVGAP